MADGFIWKGPHPAFVRREASVRLLRRMSHRIDCTCREAGRRVSAARLELDGEADKSVTANISACTGAGWFVRTISGSPRESRTSSCVDLGMYVRTPRGRGSDGRVRVTLRGESKGEWDARSAA